MMKSTFAGAAAVAIAGTAVLGYHALQSPAASDNAAGTVTQVSTPASPRAPRATSVPSVPSATTVATPVRASAPTPTTVAAPSTVGTPSGKAGATTPVATKPVAKRFSTNNVMGLPSMKVLGVPVSTMDGPFPGDGHAPVSACQQDRFAALGATSVATIRVWGTGKPLGAVYEVAGQFRTVAAAKKAEATAIRWVAQCSAWSRSHLMANPVPSDKSYLPAPSGVPAYITWWRLGGTDHEAGPINGSVTVVRVDNRVAMYTNFFPQFLTADGAVKLAQRSAAVLAK